MSKRKISPFTQEILQEIEEENGIITIDLIADKLQGWSFTKDLEIRQSMKKI